METAHPPNATAAAMVDAQLQGSSSLRFGWSKTQVVGHTDQ